MRILISVALWGREYRETFAQYSLTSQLAPGNLPQLSKDHDVVYQIITTRKDAAWLCSQPAVQELAKYCQIEWDLVEEHSYNPRILPVGPEGSKYSFLSLLQNIAISRSLEYDALVFNYADFIWANYSMLHSVGMLTEGVDAVLGFCLPVDKHRGMRELDRCRTRSAAGTSALDLPPRRAADIAIRKMHREARLRYWDGPAFTITPSYLLWPVGKEGVIIRAYHQTILVLRVKGNDPAYRGGISGGSLDGYFTTLLAERSNVRHAVNSDEVMVFSLYDTIIDSRIGGPSRSSQAEWVGYGKEESLRECLREIVSEGQRKFALVPIEVRRSYDHPARWRHVAEETERFVRRFHETTTFDPEKYEHVHTQDSNLNDMAKRWRVDTTFAALAILFYQQIMLNIVLANAGPTLKQLLGVGRARALRQRAELLVYGAKPANGPPPAETLIDPFARPSALAMFPSLAGMLRRVEQTFSRDGLARAAIKFLQPVLTPLLSDSAERLLDSLIGPERGKALRNAVAGHLAAGFAIIPGVEISGRASVLFSKGIAIETRIPCLTSLAALDEKLCAAEGLFREVVTDAPDWPDGHRALGRNLWFQSRFKDALDAFMTADLCAARSVTSAGWDPAAGVILPDNTVEVIGLIGHIDAFIKNKILADDSRPYYLTVRPGQQVANRAFLEYWADFVEIVTDSDEVERLSPLRATYGTNWNWVFPHSDGTLVHIHTGIARVQHRWEKEGRGPLLELKISHAELLAAQKAKWGMNPTEWFVCLHVRSGGFYAEEIGGAQHFRNTPIEDYYEAIRFITQAGGWVVRMGDPSMPPIDLAQCGPFSDRIIDYAHASERSDELDIALCGSCRLFVSGPSGLHTVAHAFGRPVCPINFPLYAGFPWHPGEVFIPQRYFSRSLGRVESLEEIFASDQVYADHQFLLERADIELIRNTPDEIVETVREALDPEAYNVANADIGRQVRERFHQLNKEYRLESEANLGLYFASKYAHQLWPDIATGGVQSSVTDNDALEASAAVRRLDVVIPSFNRPARLYHLLKTGLALALPGMTFVVIDDGSTRGEDVPGLGFATTAQVCASFGTKRIIYTRNSGNIGVAASWERYYRDICTASYTMSVTDKDEFVDRQPIESALEKLEADHAVNLVVIPLRQKDRASEDREISFRYSGMSGEEYLACYVQDNALQHCSMWGIIRADAIREAGVPRSLGLREHGLDDGFGIDIDFVFMVAALGNVGFETRPHVRRSTIEGGTEKFPLTFAYTYYQYAKRAMRELAARGIVTRQTVQKYMRWWLLLICRGLVVAYRPVHGSELESGTDRIRHHLSMPVLLYLPVECIRHRIAPTWEMIGLYFSAAKLMSRRAWERWDTRQAQEMKVIR